MIEIGLLVDRQQLDRCCPKPAEPFPAGVAAHLPAMRLADDGGEISGDIDGLRGGQSLDLELKSSFPPWRGRLSRSAPGRGALDLYNKPDGRPTVAKGREYIVAFQTRSVAASSHQASLSG